MTALPSRYSEKSFRRFESTIKTIVERFPTSVELDPPLWSLSLSTLSNRLRDAIKSLHLNHWKTIVNINKLDEIYINLVVSEQTGRVVIGDRITIRNSKTKNHTRVPITITNPVVINAPPSVVRIITEQLVAKNAVNQPIFYRGAPEFMAELENDFDVVTTLQEDGTYKIT